MDKLLKGKEVADNIDEEIRKRLPAFYDQGTIPTLAIVRVGDNPSDMAYEKGAEGKARKIGLQCEKYICPEDIGENDLIAVIRAINEDGKIHGILLLQPLPKHINTDAVRNALSPEKDLDCISDQSLAKLFVKNGEGFPPCTAESCLEILRHYDIPIKGKKVVVLGRSMVIGKPVALMLLEKDASVTICHSKTSIEDRRAYCRNADILVAATGHPDTVTADMVDSGQIIVDVGINFDANGKMVGDVGFEAVSGIIDAITPVPGGVGSVTTSLLMKHLVDAAEKTLV